VTRGAATPAPVLVTGAAGFIGYHVSRALLARGDHVVGIDNMNAYYDVALKEARLAKLSEDTRFTFFRGDIADDTVVSELFAATKPASVVHLAAQAGVRYSIDHPHAYGASNMTGFLNVLEGCRHGGVAHLVFASSSSVYGANRKMPFSVTDPVDHPVSLYAATKKANELMAYTYSHLYHIPSTGLRFFTVYGPWGRPDMAYYKFTAAILAGRPIDVFNHGNLQRDFTYIDDIVDGVLRTLDRVPSAGERPQNDADASYVSAPYRLYNIGNSSPVQLMHFIDVLERCLGREARRRLVPMQPGDVFATYADVSDLERDVGFAPSTSIEDGLRRFVDWYLEYHGDRQPAPR
jgi:UDP-glucuronate 4-epimerase